MRELILGGQKSGKSTRAEQLAATWLAQDCSHCVVFIATAQALDDEMYQRITRHQTDRAMRLPEALTVEEPIFLAQTLMQYSNARTLVIVDCLTVWLCNGLMPAAIQKHVAASFETQQQALLHAIRTAAGPVALVSNEIGLGVIPMGQQVRAYVDALGLLNQALACICDRVTLMAAGLPLTLKGQP